MFKEETSMARSKVVQLAEKPFTVVEFKVGELRNQVIPKLLPLWGVFQGVDKVEDGLAKIGDVEAVLGDVFGIEPERFDEAFPSELEEFVEAFIEVNFFGLKKLFGQALSLNRGLMFKS
jgi:hypothetical protein